jgi:hypothetical protein
LGGTGIEILRKFKRRYADLYDRDQRYIKLLGIDTAEQIASSDPFLKKSEFLHLGDPSVDVSEIIAQRDDNPCLSWVQDRVPPFQIVAGAGMKRLYGHLAYFWRGQDIKRALEKAIADLYDMAVARDFDVGSDCRIFVVSSVCGGTGTGMFLDISYWLQNMFTSRGHSAINFGLLLLPSTFAQLQGDPSTWESIHANGYAALQELNYYMRQSFEAVDLPCPDQFAPKLRLNRSPYDLCYLLGGVNASGNRTTSSTELYEKAADFIFINAILPNIRQRIAQTAVNIDRSFASFGSYSMALPYSRYIEKYLLNMGKELLEDVLVSDADAQVGDWSNALTSLVSFRAASELAAGTADLNLASTKLRNDVFVHRPPSDQSEATATIDSEWTLLNRARPSIEEEFQNRGKELERDLEGVIEQLVRAEWKIAKGTTSRIVAVLDAIAKQIDSVKASLVIAQPPELLASIYDKFREAPGLRGLITREKPAERVNAFRAAIEISYETELTNKLKDIYSRIFSKSRTDIDQRRTLISELRSKAPSVIADFKQNAVAFLEDRRKQDPGAALQAIPIGEANIPQDEYQQDRLGLLNRCRSGQELNPSALLGAPDKPKLDLPRYVQELYKVVARHVGQQKTNVRLTERDRLVAGLNDAEVNLHIKFDPRSDKKHLSWVFIPQDQQLKSDVLDAVSNWGGAHGVTPEAYGSMDESILTVVQLVTSFKLRELAEMQEMASAYERKKQRPNEALYLDLPTHQRMEIFASASADETKKSFALALILGVLRELGQNFEFRGRDLLPTDVADKVERRRRAYECMIDPDRKRFVESKLRDKFRACGSNAAFAQFVYECLSHVYPDDLDPQDEYCRLLVDEKAVVDTYLASLGATGRPATRGN